MRRLFRTLAGEPEGETSFVLLPKHWVVEHNGRFRCLSRDYECLSSS